MTGRFRSSGTYRLLTTILAILIYPLMLMRERGRIRLAERYGHWNLRGEEVVWFHGASIGEINGLKPLIEKYKNQGGVKILVTSVSVSGIQSIEGQVDFTRLLPFDAPFAIGRAIRDLKIEKFIFGETEIWPNLLSFLTARGVPIFMVNARIAQRNVHFYKILRLIAGNFWSAIAKGYAGSQSDAKRLKAAGGVDFAVVGNLKYDFVPSESKIQASALFLHQQPIVVFGSVRPGEESAVLDAILAVRKSGLQFNCIIAPRHKEKFNFFKEYFTGKGLSIQLRSQGVAAGDTVLLDTFGELQHVYPLAEVAFIGATLVNIGGHNPIEAAQHGVPVVVGNYVQNISDLVSDMLAQEAIVQVFNAKGLAAAIAAALRGELKNTGLNGKRFADSLRGNTARVFEGVFVEGKRP